MNIQATPADRHETLPVLAPIGEEPYLLTPGPLTTSRRTKEAMLRDWGSWDRDFNLITAEIRRRLVEMCDGQEDYDCVPMQGSGTFSVEAALASFLPRDSKTLVLMNGAYGQRAAKTLDYLGRAYIRLDTGDYLPPRPEQVDALLSENPEISHVVVVHCETSSGILNPLQQISDVVQRHQCKLIVDAMSAFGGVPLSVSSVPFEVMVSSANKCIEGVPGFGFIIARKRALEAARGASHSLSLDLHEQWSHMNKTGQWRFTPPTHTVVAFHEALLQHAEEGGVAGRHGRYNANRDVLVSGMRRLGFETLLADRWLSPIITTFFCPDDSNFQFARFYEELKARRFIIYPGKLTVVDSFRVGCIGQLTPEIMAQLLDAVADTCRVMGVSNCAPPATALEQRTLQY